jgi:ribonuclease BN (tRNA processing enzyme)
MMRKLSILMLAAFGTLTATMWPIEATEKKKYLNNKEEKKKEYYAFKIKSDSVQKLHSITKKLIHEITNDTKKSIVSLDYKEKKNINQTEGVIDLTGGSKNQIFHITLWEELWPDIKGQAFQEVISNGEFILNTGGAENTIIEVEENYGQFVALTVADIRPKKKEIKLSSEAQSLINEMLNPKDKKDKKDKKLHISLIKISNKLEKYDDNLVKYVKGIIAKYIKEAAGSDQTVIEIDAIVSDTKLN